MAKKPMRADAMLDLADLVINAEIGPTLDAAVNGSN